MRRLIFGIFIIVLGLPAALSAEVKIIELKHRPAADLVGKVREILDDGEKVTDAGNHLVLIADGESLQAAQQLISLLDRQRATLVVRLQQAESRQRLARENSGSISYSNRSQLSGTASSGLSLGNSTRQTEQSLRVMEGEGGWLEVGKDIPYTEEWAVLSGESSGYAERINYKTIAIGFWVQPVRLVDGGALLDIEPRFSRLDGAQSDPPQIRFSNLRSRLRLQFGQWQSLASHVQQTNRVSRAILQWRSDSGETDEELFIRIDPEAGFSP